MSSHSTTTVSLLGDRKLNTLALGQTDPWLLLANDEHVALAGGERVVDSILDVDNIETSIVALTVSNDTNTTHIATTSHHGDDAGVKANEVGDLASGKVDFDRVIDLDCGIWVTDRASIMRNQEWDSSSSELYSLDLAQLVFGFCRLDAVDREAAFGVVDKSEVLAGLVDRDHVHVASWVCGVCSDFAIDFDETLHDNLLDFTAIESVLETISDEDDEGEAVAEFVRTR